MFFYFFLTVLDPPDFCTVFGGTETQRELKHQCEAFWMLSVNNETVGYLVVLAYACLPAVSRAIADFQVVVEFRTR